MRGIPLALAAIGVLFSGSPATSSDVNIRTGGVTSSAQDLIYSNGSRIGILRAYNSKSPRRGIFGWGWSCPLETYLETAPDGSVVVHEAGGGLHHRYRSSEETEKSVQADSEAIVRAAHEENFFGQESQYAEYRKKLLLDPEYRNLEWAKLKQAKRLEARTIREGTNLRSSRYSNEGVTRLPRSYVRKLEDGTLETFTDSGKLSRIAYPTKDFIELAYNPDGSLKQISDNLGRKLMLKSGTQGLIELVEGADGRRAEFRYNPLGELISAKDSGGKTTQYEYDSLRRHNLTRVAYPDGTAETFSYFGRDQRESIRSFKMRGGLVHEYSYPVPMAVRDVIKHPSGKIIAATREDLSFKHHPDGEKWLYRSVVTRGGKKVVTTFSECCGLPVSIQRPSGETLIEYDTRGHIIKKTTPVELIEVNYDAAKTKVLKVRKIQRSGNPVPVVTEFAYDAKDNLTMVRNSRGQGVRLFYGSAPGPIALVDSANRRINIKYDETGNPIEISEPGVGTLKMAYSNAAEIKTSGSSGEGSGGLVAALKIRGFYRGLVSLMQSADVSPD